MAKGTPDTGIFAGVTRADTRINIHVYNSKGLGCIGEALIALLEKILPFKPVDSTAHPGVRSVAVINNKKASTSARVEITKRYPAVPGSDFS